MDREKFKESFDNFRFKNIKSLSNKEINDFLKESINKTGEKEATLRFPSYRKLIICIEEFQELSKELTKALRNKENFDGILEELADVSICIEYIKMIFGINEEELQRAKTIKILELHAKEKLDS